MAIYRLSVQVISRAAGRSAVAAAAYRAGEELTCEQTGNVHDYTRKGGVEHSEILAPETAPAWARERARLWNRVEAAEKRKDSQLAREVQLALPRELSRAERIELTREFVHDQFVSRGMVADVAIHAPKTSAGETQPHAHILLTTREVGPEGFGKKARAWNATEVLEGWREAWASHANRALERAGHEARIDHRSLKAQRTEAEQIANDNSRPEPERRLAEVRAIELDREPQPKLGAAADMERRGIQTDRGDQLRTVLAENAQRRTLLEQIRDWGRQVKERALDLAGRFIEQVKQWTPEHQQALTTLRQYQEADRAAAEGWERLTKEAEARGIEPGAHPGVREVQQQVQERDRLATRVAIDVDPHFLKPADWERIGAQADAHHTRHIQQRRARAEAARAQADAAKMERAVHDRIQEQRQRQAALEQRRLEEKAQGRDPVTAFQALSQLQRQAQGQGQKQRAEDIQKQMQQRAQDIQRTGQMDRLRQLDAQAAQQAQQMARTQSQGRGWR